MLPGVVATNRKVLHCERMIGSAAFFGEDATLGIGSSIGCSIEQQMRQARDDKGQTIQANHSHNQPHDEAGNVECVL
jgi:hypothetical protein